MIPIRYIPKFIPNADEAFSALKTELEWVRIGNTPRNEYYCNDFGVPYTYGNEEFARSYESQPYHPVITSIRNAIEKETGTIFEVCFLNFYQNQKDQLGWHADDSPEMDDARPIAIVSLGVEREIWFKEIGASNNPEDVTKIKLENGSLCLMLPGMQDTHLHRIPKASFVCGPRISLTFRGYVR